MSKKQKKLKFKKRSTFLSAPPSTRRVKIKSVIRDYTPALIISTALMVAIGALIIYLTC